MFYIVDFVVVVVFGLGFFVWVGLFFQEGQSFFQMNPDHKSVKFLVLSMC